MFRTYKNKLIMAFILISIIPIFTIGFSMNFKIRSEVIKEAIQVEKERTNHEIEKMEVWFRDKEQILRSIGTNYPLLEDMIQDSNSFYEVSKYLKSHVSSEDSFVNIFITTVNGTQYNSQFTKVDQDTRLRDWYTNAYESRKVVWTQPYKDLLTKETVVTVSMPLVDKYGNIQAILGADVDFKYLTSRFERIRIDDAATTYTMDTYGEISKVIGEDILDGQNTKIVQLLKNIDSKEVEYKDLELDKEYFGIYGTIPSIDWKIISLVDKNAFFTSLTTVKKFIIVTFVIAIILIIVASILFSRMFSKSLEKLKAGTLEIQRGNYDYRINVDRNDEFGHLSKAFNNMVSNLKSTYDKLTDTTNKLAENNEQLQEMNIELEASYEQLQATTEQLNESEAKYRTLIENMHDLIWVIDANYRLMFINDQIEKILGINREDVIGKDIRTLNFIRENISDLSHFDKIMVTDLKNEVIKFTSKNSESIILELNTKHIYEGGNLIAIQGVARDVTKRTLMEKEIIQRNKELSIINDIGISLNSVLDLNTLLERAVHDIIGIMDISLCTIRLLKEGDILKLMACGGELSHLVKDEYIPIEEDIMGESIKTGKVIELNIKDEEYINSFNKDILESNKANYSTVFPLKARDKTLGVLIVSTKGKLNESIFKIISSLTNQLTIKIDNIKLYQDLKSYYIKTIKTLAAAVEAKDKYTEGHSLRVAKYAVMIAKWLKLSDKFCEEIEVAGILHDIGKIGVSDDILTKPGKLDNTEFKIVTEHPIIGSRILKDVGFSDDIMDSIKYHHKRYDLKGYPFEEELEELPLGACIIGVVDAFDAMTSNRSYRSSMTFKAAIDELVQNRGTQFSPEVVDAMLEIFKENTRGLLEVAVTD